MEPGTCANGVPATQAIWLLIAVIMLPPILMLVLSLTVNYPVVRCFNIITAVLSILFNLVGLANNGAYDNFLIAVSIIFNALTIWSAC